ncbi:transporter substrate-binding domain-containing protein [Mesorhizobium sp. M0494]|uniref:transporter substrate-binding domain-containing protein n=1 Tax=Mesorhizobium sp. M0494 TaxID=2956951 RepID=UPI00333B36AC
MPWVYPGEKNVRRGFDNGYTLGVLWQMGYDKIELVVTDWAALSPDLNGNRFGVVTGGTYITGARYENIQFSGPTGRFGDACIVAAGNPKDIRNYSDIKEKDGVMVTGDGYNIVATPKRPGVPNTISRRCRQHGGPCRDAGWSRRRGCPDLILCPDPGGRGRRCDRGHNPAAHHAGMTIIEAGGTWAAPSVATVTGDLSRLPRVRSRCPIFR